MSDEPQLDRRHQACPHCKGRLERCLVTDGKWWWVCTECGQQWDLNQLYQGKTQDKC